MMQNITSFALLGYLSIETDKTITTDFDEMVFDLAREMKFFSKSMQT